jgi:glycerophosphoryl diester phosphodiesterase
MTIQTAVILLCILKSRIQIMAKFLISFIIFFLIISGSCQKHAIDQSNNLSRILQTLHNPSADQILVVAHRALHTQYPENSLAAVRHAIESGLDMIEIDVRRTKDGVLVLMHDEKVERTTDGSGRISELTYAEVRQLSLKKRADDPLTHPVPRLLEILQLTKDQILVDVDIKAAPLNELVDAVKQTGTIEQVLFFQHYNATHDSLMSIEPGMMIVPRADSHEEVLIFIERYHPVAIQIPAEVASEKLVLRMKTAGCAVWINALGAADILAAEGRVEAAFQPLIKKGANLIQGDQPALLLNYLRTSRLHW